MPDLYNCYLLALKEYTIDSRGDIGAWVREAAMIGLHVRRFRNCVENIVYENYFELSTCVRVYPVTKRLHDSQTTYFSTLLTRKEGKKKRKKEKDD